MRKEVLMCVKYNQWIELVYLSANGSISKRRVHVQAIGKETFKGYCHLRQSYRIFYFNRVLAVFQVHYDKKEVEFYEESYT